MLSSIQPPSYHEYKSMINTMDTSDKEYLENALKIWKDDGEKGPFILSNSDGTFQFPTNVQDTLTNEQNAANEGGILDAYQSIETNINDSANNIFTGITNMSLCSNWTCHLGGGANKTPIATTIIGEIPEIILKAHEKTKVPINDLMVKYADIHQKVENVAKSYLRKKTSETLIKKIKKASS
jgi:hypothetical protein